VVVTTGRGYLDPWRSRQGFHGRAQLASVMRMTTAEMTTHQTAETQLVDAGGVWLAFRRFGTPVRRRC
jgi:hypothetical protein